MLPAEKALVKRLKDKPFALLGINSDPADKIRKMCEDEGITWRNAVEGSTRGPIATQWNVSGWPTIYVIDAKGVIRGRDPSDKGLEEMVDALLKEAEQGGDRK